MMIVSDLGSKHIVNALLADINYPPTTLPMKERFIPASFMLLPLEAVILIRSTLICLDSKKAKKQEEKKFKLVILLFHRDDMPTMMH